MDENKTKWLGSIMDMMEAHFGKVIELVLHNLEADYEKTIIDTATERLQAEPLETAVII